MQKVELVLQLKKSTKGFHVYGDEDGTGPIPSIYVRKDALSSPPPQKLQVDFGGPYPAPLE